MDTSGSRSESQPEVDASAPVTTSAGRLNLLLSTLRKHFVTVSYR